MQALAAREGPAVRQVPGDHYSMLREPNVGALAGELAEGSEEIE